MPRWADDRHRRHRTINTERACSIGSSSWGRSPETADPLPWLSVNPIFAGVVALAGAYTAVMQRKTGKETEDGVYTLL